MWHKQSFTQFWSQSDAYSRRSSLKLTYIHHPLVVCTHQICCAVAVPIALSQDRLLHGHNRLVNWTPCSRMRESKLKKGRNGSIGIRIYPSLKPLSWKGLMCSWIYPSFNQLSWKWSKLSPLISSYRLPTPFHWGQNTNDCRDAISIKEQEIPHHPEYT